MADFLTVGIPVWNDPESIVRSITSIVHSTAWVERKPSERELIVCVNGVKNNRDETLEVVRRLSKVTPQLRVISTKAKGQNVASNFIAKKSNPRSKIIFFCDADVLVKRNTIQRVVDALKTREGVKFAGAMVTPATALVPEKNRSSFKSYFLKRHKERVKTRGDFISGAGWAVDREFFLNNPLPPTSKIANDLYINTKFKGKIVLVHNAELFYLLPSPKDRLFQRARYLVQEKAQGLKQQTQKSSGVRIKLTPKERRGFIINKAIDKLAKGLVTVNPRIGWMNLSSTKLKTRRR
jgi:glycosyltransferase involved in cell wall biosynthesis